jgi:hypothetical protein
VINLILLQITHILRQLTYLLSKNIHITLFDTCDLDGFIAEPKALFGSLEGNEMEYND